MNGYDAFAVCTVAWMVVQLARITAAYRAAARRAELKSRGTTS